MRIKTKKDVEEYFSGDKIECLICGKLFKSLGAHIPIHNYTVDEYKQKFNLPWGRGLTSEKTHQKSGKIMLQRIKTDKRLQLTPEIMEKAQKAPKRKLRDYEIKRVKDEQIKITERHRDKRINGANKILDLMKKEKLPACYITCRTDTIHQFVFSAALREYPTLKTRFDKIRKKNT